MYPLEDESILFEIADALVVEVRVSEHQIDLSFDNAKISIFGDVSDNNLTTPGGHSVVVSAFTTLVGDRVLRMERVGSDAFSIVPKRGARILVPVDSDQFECVEVEIGSRSEVY